MRGGKMMSSYFLIKVIYQIIRGWFMLRIIFLSCALFMAKAGRFDLPPTDLMTRCTHFFLVPFIDSYSILMIWFARDSSARKWIQRTIPFFVWFVGPNICLSVSIQSPYSLYQIFLFFTSLKLVPLPNTGQWLPMPPLYINGPGAHETLSVSP